MDAHAYSFNYELGKIERIISKDMAAFIELQRKPDPELVAGFKDAIKEETEQVKDQLVNVALTLREEHDIEKFIQYHQRSLIRLAGQLLKYVRPADIHTVRNTFDNALLGQCVYQSLEDLLDFTEKHFTKYFDHNAWIPQSFRLIALHSIKEHIEPIEQRLISLQVSEELIRIALKPLKELTPEGSSNEATYRKIVYLKELKNELLAATTRENISHPNKSVRGVLFYLNFNTPEYFGYCTRYIEHVMGKSEAIAERMERLAYFLKLTAQQQVKPGFTFDPSRASLMDQLSQWIFEEMKYQKRRQRSLQASAEQTKVVHEVNFKVKLDMSVSQFAYLAKIFVDLKIIQNTNASQVLRFLSNNFQTDRADTISYDSFRSKYYDTERSAQLGVKDMLQRMMDHINLKQ